LPALTIGPALRAAAVSVLGGELPVYSLRIWHGWTPTLLMSLLAFALGCVVFFAFRRRFPAIDKPPLSGPISARQAFDRLLIGLVTHLPNGQKRLFPERRLQRQLLLLVVMAALLTLLAIGSISLPDAMRGTPVEPIFAAVWLLGGGCAIGAAAHAKFRRLAALVLTGGAGLAVCITFAWLSAPDLAVTQLLVEAVTTILILLGLRWLPPRIPGLA